MVITFNDVNGVPREHNIGEQDLELWLAGYTTNGNYPVTNLEIVEID